MAIAWDGLRESLAVRLGSDGLDWTSFRGQYVLHLKPDRILEILAFLRDDPMTRFEMLTDLTAYDRLRMSGGRPERFVVVYQLTSLRHQAGFRLNAYLPEERPEIASATGLWPAAGWAEREVFDMYGIFFRGHPDLKRILMPESFVGHPLRKDYPLKGRGERDRFQKYTGIPEEGKA